MCSRGLTVDLTPNKDKVSCVDQLTVAAGKSADNDDDEGFSCSAVYSDDPFSSSSADPFSQNNADINVLSADYSKVRLYF